MAADPMNHAALLTPDNIDAFRSETGLDLDTEWDRFSPDSPAGLLCSSVGESINNQKPANRPTLAVPAGARPVVTNGSPSSQESFGRVLASLADDAELARRIVTTAPDVSISTN